MQTPSILSLYYTTSSTTRTAHNPRSLTYTAPVLCEVSSHDRRIVDDRNTHAEHAAAVHHRRVRDASEVVQNTFALVVPQSDLPHATSKGQRLQRKIFRNAQAPASPAQGFHCHGPWYYSFPYLCMNDDLWLLEKLRLADQNRLVECDLSVFVAENASRG